MAMNPAKPPPIQLSKPGARIKTVGKPVKARILDEYTVPTLVERMINLEGPPVEDHHTMLMLAGAIYLIETGRAEILGFDMQCRSFDERERNPALERMPFEFRITVRSEMLPAIGDICSLSDQEAFCERVSQWFASRAIALHSKAQELVKK